MAALEHEIYERLSTLGPEQKRQVLEYARALSEAPRRGVPGKALLRFSGSIPMDGLRAMAQTVEEGCERADPNGW